MPDPGDLTSALDQIRDLIAERDTLLAATDWSGVSLSGFNAAQDKLAARVPSLVAAIERVLKLADGTAPGLSLTPPDCTNACDYGDCDCSGEGRAVAWNLDPAKVREAITAALTGSQPGEGESSDE